VLTDRLTHWAVQAVSEVKGPVEVTGSDALADAIRQALPRARPEPNDRPSAVIETTGDPQMIEEPTRRLADEGILVLAGEPSEPAVELNLYPDVHGRGLWVVGVGP
jgi:hypothetical protein